MDKHRFDDLTRRLATPANRRRFLGLLAGIVGAAIGTPSRLTADAACPPGQVQRRGIGCICRTTGRHPVGGHCPCPRGQIDTGDGLGCMECRSTDECPPRDACASYACVDGACTKTKLVCDDGNPCTSDVCDPVVGCVYTALPAGQPGECVSDQVCCGGGCTSLGTVTDCASCGHVCPEPENASAMCISRTCDFTCNAGYTVCNNICERVAPIPDNILGGEITWLLEQFNGGAHTLTEEEFFQHFSEGITFESTLAFFKSQTPGAPWEFAGFIGSPMAVAGSFTLIWDHRGRQVGSLELQSRAPHRIRSFRFEPGAVCP